ncbi:MAG TPA: hydroxymethylbilane synthase [Kineosporiaceae bacterium]
MIVRLGTRRSALATAQSRWVAAWLETTGVAAGVRISVELVEMTSHGDVSSAPLSSFGGVGVFVTRLRQALLGGEVDIVVHSLKDLPTAPAAGLLLAAVPPREDPRDVLVARAGSTLGELPTGARIGTGSPRRAAQLRALGLGLEVVDLRGNVDTRLRFVAEGRLDGVVVARAGLVRLGRADEATEVLDPLVMLPAPGQGALAVECRDRAADEPLASLLARLDDRPTRAAVSAERSLLAALEAGCTAPLGALAEVAEGDEGEELSLRAVVAAPDGSVCVRRSTTGPVDAADRLGKELAAGLLEEGIGELIRPVGASTVRNRAASPDPNHLREGDT